MRPDFMQSLLQEGPVHIVIGDVNVTEVLDSWVAYGATAYRQAMITYGRPSNTAALLLYVDCIAFILLLFYLLLGDKPVQEESCLNFRDGPRVRFLQKRAGIKGLTSTTTIDDMADGDSHPRN